MGREALCLTRLPFVPCDDFSLVIAVGAGVKQIKDQPLI
jgi:hypothetical protein